MMFDGDARWSGRVGACFPCNHARTARSLMRTLCAVRRRAADRLAQGGPLEETKGSRAGQSPGVDGITASVKRPKSVYGVDLCGSSSSPELRGAVGA